MDLHNFGELEAGVASSAESYLYVKNTVCLLLVSILHCKKASTPSLRNTFLSQWVKWQAVQPNESYAD